MTICACPFCFAEVEQRGDYCPSCLDVRCTEVFAPRAPWTYEWPRMAQVLFRAQRALSRTRTAMLTFLRWLFAYDRCCGCGEWHPRSATDCVEFINDTLGPENTKMLRFCFCPQCRQGKTHEELQYLVMQTFTPPTEEETAP